MKRIPLVLLPGSSFLAAQGESKVRAPLLPQAPPRAQDAVGMELRVTLTELSTRGGRRIGLGVDCEFSVRAQIGGYAFERALGSSNCRTQSPSVMRVDRQDWGKLPDRWPDAVAGPRYDAGPDFPCPRSPQTPPQEVAA